MRSLPAFLLGLSLLINSLNAMSTQLEQQRSIFQGIEELIPISDGNGDEDFIYDGRIVGGYPTNIETFPYQGSLQRRGSHICGCSIIDKNIVLTAAHCVDKIWITSFYKVRVGSTQQRYGGQLLNIKRIIPHEGYNSNTMEHDIAIILLSSDITFSPSAAPISLANAEDNVPANSRLLVSGWGLTSETGSVVSQLRYVAIQLVDQQTCVRNYRPIATITDRMFCAGTTGKDSCQGDSGGPLVGRTPVSGEGIQLYGIVSWGVGCAQAGFPGVYVKVAAYRKWINDTTDALKLIDQIVV